MENQSEDDQIESGSDYDSSLEELASFQHTHASLLYLPELQFCCPICSFVAKAPKPDQILEHLAKHHQFIISDVEKIADLPSYLSYWKDKFKDHLDSLHEFTSVIVSKDSSGADQKFNFLTDNLPEDRILRSNLQQQRLELALKKQQEERALDSQPQLNARRCLFCKDRLGKRKELFKHLYKVHGLNIGSPENLVDIERLLNILQTKLDNCVCIYCEKTFKNHTVLKLHMKKKKHFKINSRNKDYDVFYMINYLEPENAMRWSNQLLVSPSPSPASSYGSRGSFSLEDQDSDLDPEKARRDAWDDWGSEKMSGDDEDDTNTVCLFCDHISEDAEACLEHAKTCHSFDLRKLQSDWNMEFYDTIRLINYIRYQMSVNSCPTCSIDFDSPNALSEHLTSSNHYSVPAPNSEDQPDWMKEDRFLQPLNESDPLLRDLFSGDVDSDDDEQALGDFSDDEKEESQKPVTRYHPQVRTTMVHAEDVSFQNDRVRELEKAFYDSQLI